MGQMLGMPHQQQGAQNQMGQMSPEMMLQMMQLFQGGAQDQDQKHGGGGNGMSPEMLTQMMAMMMGG